MSRNEVISLVSIQNMEIKNLLVCFYNGAVATEHKAGNITLVGKSIKHVMENNSLDT